MKTRKVLKIPEQEIDVHGFDSIKLTKSNILRVATENCVYISIKNCKLVELKEYEKGDKVYLDNIQTGVVIGVSSVYKDKLIVESDDGKIIRLNKYE